MDKTIMQELCIPKQVLQLIKLLLPQKAGRLDKDASLKSIIDITQNWIIPREKRVTLSVNDHYLPFFKEILRAADSLNLRQTKMPNYPEYCAAIIFGATGLSHFMILRDLVYFHRNNVKFDKIIMLGGDRIIHPAYDDLAVAFKHFPSDFKSQIDQQEIISCKHEMALMELIIFNFNLPPSLAAIPIVSIFTEKSSRETQANTADTINQLISTYKLSTNLPVLFLGTLPYIVRQGLQAKLLMENYCVDTAVTFHPYLETINTPLKGELLPSLYLDEFHWLFCTMKRYNDKFMVT